MDRLHKMEVANRRLVQENAILRDSAQACRLLEEKIHTYERRVEGYREVEKRYFELEIELEQVKKELASSSHREKNPPSLPPLSHRQVRELMEKTAELIKTQESLGEIESKYSVVRSELEKMHTRVAAAEQGREEMARHLADLRLKLHQSQQLEAIRQTEVVSLRSQLVLFVQTFLSKCGLRRSPSGSTRPTATSSKASPPSCPDKKTMIKLVLSPWRAQ